MRIKCNSDWKAAGQGPQERVQDYHDCIAGDFCCARNGFRPHGDTLGPAAFVVHDIKVKENEWAELKSGTADAQNERIYIKEAGDDEKHIMP